MTDLDPLVEIRQRRAAMPDGLEVEVDRDEEEYYMQWARIVHGAPDGQGWREWVAMTNAEDHDIATFIAHAPTDIDTLLATVDRLRERLKELEEP